MPRLIFLTVLMAVVLPQQICRGETPTTGPVTPWANPVNGITVRIEQGAPVFVNRWRTNPIYVRIRNISHHAINMPIAPQFGQSVYSVSISINDKWEPVLPDLLKTSPDFCRLEPGEDLLCTVQIDNNPRVRLTEACKVLIDSPNAEKPDDWSGRIETPPVAAYLDPADIKPLLGKLPMPDHLPYLVHNTVPVRGSANRIQTCYFRDFQWENYEIVTQLALYPDQDVADFLNGLRAESEGFRFKTWCAAVAASRGDASAVAELADQGDLDREKVDFRSDAIRYVLASDPCSDSVVDMAGVLMQDHRRVDGGRTTDHTTVSEVVAPSILGGLGECKNKRAKELLLQLWSEGDSSYAMLPALADIGDPRTEQYFLQIVQSECVAYSSMSYRCSMAVLGLTKMHSRAAVPVLLDNLISYSVIDDLAEIGDPAALPALEKIVQDGKLEVAGYNANMNTYAVDHAEIAVARLHKEDSTARLCALLKNRIVSDRARYEVVEPLVKSADPSVVPVLLDAIANDPNPRVTTNAIEGMASFHTRAAVYGLIQSLGWTKARGTNDRIAYSSDDLDDLIVRSLRTMTGQSFGPNSWRWQVWWFKQGRFDPRFSS